MASPNETAAQNETREIPALTLRADVRPGSVNVETRTVDLIWSTGARVLRGYYEQFYEELSLDPKHVRMTFLKSGRAPVLNTHARYSMNDVIGVIEDARVDGKQATATIRFAKAEDDAEADKIFRKIQDGIGTTFSVGYRIHKLEKVEAGEGKIPVYRATDWEPFELSPVPIPADVGAFARSHPELPLGEKPGNPCVFITRSQEPTTMPEIKPDATVTPAVPVTPAPTSLDAVREAKIRDEAATAERARSAGITAAVRAAKLDEKFGADLIEKGVSLDAARAAVLGELAKADEAVETSSHIRITDDSRDKFLRGVSAWLFEKAGNKLVARAASMKVDGFDKLELDGAEFRGMKISDIARACIERAGGSLRGIYRDEDIIKRAISTRTGEQTTSDFAVLFENVMFKQMRAAYAVQSDSWRRWMGTDTVSNFLTHSRFLNGSFGTLPVVNEGGEYTNLAVPDGAKNTISTETRGAKIALSRQAMINDDMGALSDAAVRFGMSAGRTIESQAYAMITLNTGLGPTMADGQPFFHSNRANVSTGAALSVAALSADKVAMRAQKDVSSNDWLDLIPSILLVPTGLEDAAKVINASAFDHDSTKLQKPNPVVGLFTDIVSSPRLTASTTRRYLFTAAKEAFKVVFLEGSGEGPTMESREGWDIDGLEWKARIDFKVNAYDPKTAITNAGT